MLEVPIVKKMTSSAMNVQGFFFVHKSSWELESYTIERLMHKVTLLQCVLLGEQAKCR